MGKRQCPAYKGSGISSIVIDGKKGPCLGCGGSKEIDTPDPNVVKNVAPRGEIFKRKPKNKMTPGERCALIPYPACSACAFHWVPGALPRKRSEPPTRGSA
jgi:hypothetical protein